MKNISFNFNEKGFEDLELSTQILIKEAKNRNIKVELLDRKDNFLRLIKKNKVEYVKQATKTSADKYITFLIMENKLVTKKVLIENKIQTPAGDMFNSIEDAVASFSKYKKLPLVIKPNSTNYGIGITILKDYNLQDYEEAVKSAFLHDSSIIVEEFFEGKEYRFLVINNEVAGILHRVPANVIGDGESTIEQLVKIKNKSPLRNKGHVTPLEFIELGDIEKEFLKGQKKNFQYIPEKNEQVFLRKNSNISTGGDSIDYTDDIINDYKEIAVQAVNAVGAKISGVDIIIKNIKEKPAKKNYTIIELNFNPALHIHNFPYIGKNRHVEKKVLDLLGF